MTPGSPEWVSYWNGRLETCERILAGCPEMGESVREFVEAQAALAVEFRDRTPDRQPPPNDRWCVGCSPDNCSGCR